MMIHVNVPEMVIKKKYFCTFEGEKLPILNFNAPWKFSHGTLKITQLRRREDLQFLVPGCNFPGSLDVDLHLKVSYLTAWIDGWGLLLFSDYTRLCLGPARVATMMSNLELKKPDLAATLNYTFECSCWGVVIIFLSISKTHFTHRILTHDSFHSKFVLFHLKMLTHKLKYPIEMGPRVRIISGYQRNGSRKALQL